MLLSLGGLVPFLLARQYIQRKLLWGKATEVRPHVLHHVIRGRSADADLTLLDGLALGLFIDDNLHAVAASAGRGVRPGRRPGLQIPMAA